MFKTIRRKCSSEDCFMVFRLDHRFFFEFFFFFFFAFYRMFFSPSFDNQIYIFFICVDSRYISLSFLAGFFSFNPACALSVCPIYQSFSLARMLLLTVYIYIEYSSGKCKLFTCLTIENTQNNKNEKKEMQLLYGPTKNKIIVRPDDVYRKRKTKK